MADNEIESLRADVIALRDELKNLRSAISDAQGTVRLSMRDQVRCPVCGNRKIARFDTLPDMSVGGPQPRGVAAQKSTAWRAGKLKGVLQAFACVSCGLLESYVADTSFFVDEPDLYTLLEFEDPSTGPYR